MPTTTSDDEAFYWTPEWQEGERESAAARAAGESVLFDSDDPNDVVRWLLAVDDDD